MRAFEFETALAILFVCLGMAIAMLIFETAHEKGKRVGKAERDAVWVCAFLGKEKGEIIKEPNGIYYKMKLDIEKVKAEK